MALASISSWHHAVDLPVAARNGQLSKGPTSRLGGITRSTAFSGQDLEVRKRVCHGSLAMFSKSQRHGYTANVNCEQIRKSSQLRRLSVGHQSLAHVEPFSNGRNVDFWKWSRITLFFAADRLLRIHTGIDKKHAKDMHLPKQANKSASRDKSLLLGFRMLFISRSA